MSAEPEDKVALPREEDGVALPRTEENSPPPVPRPPRRHSLRDLPPGEAVACFILLEALWACGCDEEEAWDLWEHYRAQRSQENT